MQQSPTTRIVLCVPGAWTSPEPVAALLGDTVDFQVRPPDARMSMAFRMAADRREASLVDRDYDAIGRHSAVAYLLSPPFAAADAALTALGVLRAGRTLLLTGGYAMKCESSGIAHSTERWVALCDAVERAVADLAQATDAHAGDVARRALWSALHSALVRLPIDDGQDLFSCGMHLLGQPDAAMGMPARVRAYGPDRIQHDRRTSRLMTAFASFLLTDVPRGAVRTGHTFRASPADEAFQLLLEPCMRYEPGDLFHNPYGVWRLEGPVAAAAR